MRKSLSNLIKQTIRNLRKNQTDAEGVIWKVLRDRKFKGFKFLRQYPIVFKWRKKSRFLIADFYCHEAKLVVEIDGPIHTRQKDYDEAREIVLKSSGLNILRFDNEVVLNKMNQVLETISETMNVPAVPATPSLIKRGGLGVS